MAIKSVDKVLFNSFFTIQDIDLIIGSSYTLYDTVGTIAHKVQKHFNIKNAKSFMVDSACSSFVNAVETVDCFFESKKASKALIVVSENNSLYNDTSNKISFFLWGDGAAAVIITDSRYSDNDFEILDVNSRGLGHIGKNTDAVYLQPVNGKLKMPAGNDVFQQACKYILYETEYILKKNNIPINQWAYFIPHHANKRITDYVANELISSINKYELLGNTGSASTPIVLSQNQINMKKGDIIIIPVFGGGYSSGSILLKKC